MADKITSVVARESTGNIQITFTVPFEMIQKAEEETVAEMAKDIEIPGFRKGTAPLSKVKEKISQSALIEHSLSHLLPKSLAEAIDTHKLKLAIYPKFELIKADAGEAWQVRGITCELPEVNLDDYKNIVAGEIRAASLKKDLTKDEREQTAIKALTENIKVDTPQVLIEEEANSRLSSLLARLEKLGLALESYLSSIGKNAEDLRAEYATQAKGAIALDLILSKIAVEEGIKVDEKEIESAINMSETATPKNESGEDLESRKRLIESILRRRKALDIVSSQR